MLIDRQGRLHTIRTNRERVAVIKQTQLLSEKEQALYASLMREMDAEYRYLLESIGESIFEVEPVSLKQFIEDPYYIGESTKGLYPVLKTTLQDIFEDGTKYKEGVITGSLGWGKTTFISIALTYMVHLLMCMRDPASTYGLMAGSDMVISMLSKTLELARGVIKSAVTARMDLSPYFHEVAPYKDTLNEVKFPKRVTLACDSILSSKVLGKNVFMGAMDEVNFLGKGKNKRTGGLIDKATEVYDRLITRIESRFINLPATFLVVSSANEQGSFTDVRASQALHDPSVFVRQFSLWEVKPGPFSDEKFKVVVGSGTILSKVLTKEEEPKYDQKWLDFHPDCKILDVPEDFRNRFTKGDIEKAIRDVAGISVSRVSKFFQRQTAYYECVDDSREHPFNCEVYIFGEGTGSFQWDKLATKTMKRLPGNFLEERWTPLVNPDAKRWIHLDLALSSDSVGLCMGHVARYKEVVRRNDDTGEEYSEIAPVIYIDVMLKIKPPGSEGQIILADVRQYVYALMEHGFPIVGFSADTYQSADTLQQMKTKVDKVKVISVDRTMEPYEFLRNAFYEERIVTYHYEPFQVELFSLERDIVKRKIDHPPEGSKDIADAVAGVVYGLSTEMVVRNMPVFIQEQEAKEVIKSKMMASIQNKVENNSVDSKINQNGLPFLIG